MVQSLEDCVRTFWASVGQQAAFAACLLVLALVLCSPAVAAPVPSSLVNTIETWRWSPPSPDPSGIAYNSTSKRLLVSDGEVDEMSIFAGANYYESSLAGSLVRTSNTLGFSPEPTGVAFDSGGRLFMTDDDARRVFQIALGSNGSFDATDPATYFSTSGFGSGDPEGVAYDEGGNRLFIADGVNAEIYVISAVDGVFGNGNDELQHFDTAALGVQDPETVEFNSDSGTLFTIGTPGSEIVEATPSGALVSEIDTSYLPLVHPAGMAYAPRSTDPSKKSFYIADRKVDNDNHPSENDGAIYEVAPGSVGGTPPPGDARVAASSDDAEEAPSGSMSLTSSDLELVTDGSTVQTVGVRFAGVAVPRGAKITSVYIQFVADESQSEATSLSIRAQAADNAATFTSSSLNISARPRTNAFASWAPTPWTAGEAGSNERSPDLTPVVQEVIDRGGWASGNAMAFILTGSGHRTAVAYDGAAAKAAVLHVEFLPPSSANLPPSVNAGPDQTITLPQSAALDGTVSDDGQPNPTPTTTWSKVSGAGTVTFADPAAVDTQASFSGAGTYVLRLTANDGELTASDDVTIVVSDSAPAPTITLTARGYKVKGKQKADLAWSGATSANVDVFRNGARVVTTANDGAYTDNIDATGHGTYRYQVCEAGTTTCSAEVTITFT
jgi:uncharacterized protein YjiK